MQYHRSVPRLLSTAVFVLAEAAALAAPPPDFSFLQISDIHFSPIPHGSNFEDSRSVDTLAWVSGEARTPQKLEPLGITAPPPSFIIATGDVTEFGVIDRTFNRFEAAFKNLEIPLYVVPGNHDNTWTSILGVMRRKYGGDHYSFDKFGCHFVGIDTASPQEPVPSLEQRTLTWLADDLRKVGPTRPVFIFCHHPLSTTEYAEPYEQIRFLQTIRGYNVVLLLMGHGHGVRAERWGGLDSVMGGSTFGPNTGYSIISCVDGVLRVVYRFRETTKPMQTVLEKPLMAKARPDLEITTPADGLQVDGSGVTVKAKVRGARPQKLTASPDNTKDKTVAMEPGAGDYTCVVTTDGLLPGAHYVKVTAEFPKTTLDRAVRFDYAPSGSPEAARLTLNSGMKAGPVVAGRELLVGTTAGELLAIPLDRMDAGRVRTIQKTGGEILSPPAFAEGVVYAASGDAHVYATRLDGRLVWKADLKAPVYGTPAIGDEAVYAGDIEGIVHAVDRRTGRVLWSKRTAAFTIEQPLLLHEGVLYFGAWDGYVYALNASDGSVKWKSAGPQGQAAKKAPNRYYAPADCSPIVVGDRLFITDRAYFLAAYTLDGQYIEQISDKIAGIAASADGRSFYARGSERGLTRYGADGKKIWSSPLALGRFPIPPTEAGDRVYVCSNQGVLSAVDAGSGKTLWQYQVTPELHVMSQVGVDGAGSAYVTGMDGSVTRVRK